MILSSRHCGARISTPELTRYKERQKKIQKLEERQKRIRLTTGHDAEFMKTSQRGKDE